MDVGLLLCSSSTQCFGKLFFYVQLTDLQAFRETNVFDRSGVPVAVKWQGGSHEIVLCVSQFDVSCLWKSAPNSLEQNQFVTVQLQFAVWDNLLTNFKILSCANITAFGVGYIRQGNICSSTSYSNSIVLKNVSLSWSEISFSTRTLLCSNRAEMYFLHCRFSVFPPDFPSIMRYLLHSRSGFMCEPVR